MTDTVTFGACADMVRRQTNILEVARWLGMEVRGDRAPCPFHQEHSVGAFQFNVEKGYCHCHSCGESADAIKLTAHINGVRPSEALRELNSAFGLELPIDGKAATQEQRKARSDYEKRIAELKLKTLYRTRLKDILCELERWIIMYWPCSGDWDNRYIYSLRNRDIVCFYLDILPDDAGEQIAKWTHEMELLESSWVKRRSLQAQAASLLGDFTEMLIDWRTLVKKHKKVVQEWRKI